LSDSFQKQLNLPFSRPGKSSPGRNRSRMVLKHFYCPIGNGGLSFCWVNKDIKLRADAEDYLRGNGGICQVKTPG